MGIVISPEVAFKECHGYEYDKEKMLWSAGVIGTLSDPQERICERITILGKDKEIPEELRKRWDFFKKSAGKCSEEVRAEFPKGERLRPFLKCMSREEKRLGVVI